MLPANTDIHNAHSACMVKTGHLMLKVCIIKESKYDCKKTFHIFNVKKVRRGEENHYSEEYICTALLMCGLKYCYLEEGDKAEINLIMKDVVSG